MPSLDFSNEPKDRPKTLLIHQSEPFNAEPEDLTEFINHHITPTSLVYGRNHGPIPDIKETDYKLVVNGLVDHELKLTLSDIKALPKATVITALQVTLQLDCSDVSVLETDENQCPRSAKQKASPGPTAQYQTASTPVPVSPTSSTKPACPLSPQLSTSPSQTTLPSKKTPPSPPPSPSPKPSIQTPSSPTK